MKMNIIKIFKFLAILLCIIALFFMLIISQDSHHLSFCDHEDCSICAIIHLAQSIINVLALILTYVFIGFFTKNIISKYKTINYIYKNNSLVSLKVQLNN